MTFTPNKNIETPSHGSDVNTWDVNANANFTLIDTCFSGTLLLNATGLSGNQALTQTQVQPPFIQISGAPAAAITYTIPASIGGQWSVRNTTTGGFNVGIVSLAGGSTILVPAGTQVSMWCDGTATGMLRSDTPVAAPSLTAVIFPFAGSVAPSWALFANGQAVSRATYAALFTAIGTTYGTGDGSTTFNVPDLRGTVPAGMDVIGGSTNAGKLNTSMTPNSTTLGATGGAQTSSVNIVVTSGALTGGDNADVQVQAGSGINVANAGHQHPLNGAASNGTNVIPIVQPTMVMNYIIGI